MAAEENLTTPGDMFVNSLPSIQSFAATEIQGQPISQGEVQRDPAKSPSHEPNASNGEESERKRLKTEHEHEQGTNVSINETETFSKINLATPVNSGFQLPSGYASVSASFPEHESPEVSSATPLNGGFQLPSADASVSASLPKVSPTANGPTISTGTRLMNLLTDLSFSSFSLNNSAPHSEKSEEEDGDNVEIIKVDASSWGAVYKAFDGRSFRHNKELQVWYATNRFSTFTSLPSGNGTLPSPPQLEWLFRVESMHKRNLILPFKPRFGVIDESFWNENDLRCFEDVDINLCLKDADCRQKSSQNLFPMRAQQMAAKTKNRTLKSGSKDGEKTGKETWSESEQGCGCVRSKCLRQYCACFGDSKLCGKKCRCLACRNKEENVGTQEWTLAVQALKVELKLSCACKGTRCLKRYCECRAAGLSCNDNCICRDCMNRPSFIESFTVVEPEDHDDASASTTLPQASGDANDVGSRQISGVAPTVPQRSSTFPDNIIGKGGPEDIAQGGSQEVSESESTFKERLSSVLPVPSPGNSTFTFDVSRSHVADSTSATEVPASDREVAQGSPMVSIYISPPDLLESAPGTHLKNVPEGHLSSSQGGSSRGDGEPNCGAAEEPIS